MDEADAGTEGAKRMDKADALCGYVAGTNFASAQGIAETLHAATCGIAAEMGIAEYRMINNADTIEIIALFTSSSSLLLRCLCLPVGILHVFPAALHFAKATHEKLSCFTPFRQNDTGETFMFAPFPPGRRAKNFSGE